MNQVLRSLFLLLISSCVFAGDIAIVPGQVLDNVQFQLTRKDWVTTQSALLTVNINVTLKHADLVQARAEMMQNLNKIVAGTWHLLQFNRAQDSSGLERLTVQAQIRANQNTLTNVYQHAKQVSVPGAQYDIANIEFKPSLDETQSVRASIRSKLYQAVNDEISRLNKIYPAQNYTVNHLEFNEGSDGEQPKMNEARQFNATFAGASASPGLVQSNEISITAIVNVASNRKSGT